MPAVQRHGRTGEALASFDELIVHIEKAIGTFDSANPSIEDSHAEAEELGGRFLAMNVDGQAERTEQVKQALAEALAQGPAIRAKLEEAKARAEALKSQGSGGGRTVSAAPVPTPLTAAPQAIREPVAKVGDQVEPGPTAANPHRQELAGTEEDDKTKSRAQRFGRAFLRNTGDLSDQGKQAASTGYDFVASREDPYGSGHTIETVGVPDNKPNIHATPVTHTDVGDVVGNMIVMSAVLVEGTSRWTKRRKETNGE